MFSSQKLIISEISDTKVSLRETNEKPKEANLIWRKSRSEMSSKDFENNIGQLILSYELQIQKKKVNFFPQMVSLFLYDF